MVRTRLVVNESSARRPGEPAAGDGELIAAVDLGSNSFHMVVARVVDDQLRVVDKLRERVALASGLDESQSLTAEARERAIGTLSRFGQRLAHMDARSVRAVGTNTLRQAKDSHDFVRDAEAALGHRIEVISGPEEARLIYLGVSHESEEPRARRLVVDIGGGSTECIVGEGFEPLEVDSLYMGCIAFSRFFPDGNLKARFFDEAETAAALELQPLEHRYKRLGWDQAIGSSGTVTSVDSILRANGWSSHGITIKGLKRLRKTLIVAETAEGLELDGMPPGRASVLAPGVAILLAVFERFGLERMQASEGSLREGLVYDLVGRIHDKDIRERTIQRFSQRFAIDTEQADRVEATALRLFDSVASSWDLTDSMYRRCLGWAARLHEIGQALSYSGYHKHGAYLVRVSDMPGFSRGDQAVLAEVIANHRRKLRPARFQTLPVSEPEKIVGTAILLRLAVVLNRSRSRRAVPAVRLSARKRGLELAFPSGWLEDNDLVGADLQNEAARLAAAGYELSFS